jgi:hypothetical protein
MNRRTFVLGSSFGLTKLALGSARESKFEAAATVFKDQACGCCNGWVEHLKRNSFEVTVQEVQGSELQELKQKYRVPSDLQSCHTAVVDGYVIEGHVPAAQIQRILKERPKAIGLAVPGMPIGSPGMEGARSEKYSVLLFDSAGQSTVYREYPEHGIVH